MNFHERDVLAPVSLLPYPVGVKHVMKGSDRNKSLLDHGARLVPTGSAARRRSAGGVLSGAK